LTGKKVALAETAEKLFLSWDPQKKVETLAFQPRFVGPARDLALVVVTPTVPAVEELPTDFFHELAVFTTLSERTWPHSLLKDPPRDDDPARRPPPARVLGAGTIGTLKHQTVTAEKIDELYAWLRENNFNFAGAEETFKSYLDKKWCFTFCKVDPAKLPKDGAVLVGDIRPLRFTFACEQFECPMRIARPSVRDYLDVEFYVQAPYKIDLPGDLSYQYQWVGMLLNSRGAYPRETFGDRQLPGQADDWLKAIDKEIPALKRKGQELGFGFTNKTRPQPNKLGRSATTLQWARRLTAADIKVLRGETPYGETVPDPDQGFSVADYKNDPLRKEAVFKVIQRRQEKLARERPGGYLVRSAPETDVAKLKVLLPYLREGEFVTKLHKIFTRDELNEDLLLGPAKLGAAEDASEYTERLPIAP
jgi:hypothetical protein